SETPGTVCETSAAIEPAGGVAGLSGRHGDRLQPANGTLATKGKRRRLEAAAHHGDQPGSRGFRQDARQIPERPKRPLTRRVCGTAVRLWLAGRRIRAGRSRALQSSPGRLYATVA